MICPLRVIAQCAIDYESYKEEGGIEVDCGDKCAWWDEKKKQCCIKTLAQKDNSKVSIAR